MMKPYANGAGWEVHQACALDVASSMPDDHFSLAIIDGPYAMNKAEWDRLSVADLPEWYRPHLEAAGRILAPSASLYLWNTSEGWAALHPLLLSLGWTFRSLITWDKGVGFMAGKCDVGSLRTWYDVTEVCGFYQRENIPFDEVFGSMAQMMEDERAKTGVSRAAIDAASGCSNVSQYWWQARDWRCPTREMWSLLQSVSSGFDWDWADVKRMEADARSMHEASRPAFTAPLGLSNVWRHGQVSGPERLKGDNGAALHPCQKPLSFAERMVKASTRPGERVWVPFGGTCREALACANIARRDPDQARHCVTAEIDQDGRGYLDAVVPQLRGLSVQEIAKNRSGQTLLFSTAAK